MNNLLTQYLEQVNNCLLASSEEILRPEEDRQYIEKYEYALSNGRRLRPLLVLCGYTVTNSNYSSNAVKVGAYIELLHRMSLIADDFVDKDKLRRGHASFYNKYNDESVITMMIYFFSLQRRKEKEILKSVTINREAIELLFDEIWVDMPIGFLRDVEGTEKGYDEIRKITDMQTTTILKNSLLLGYLLDKNNSLEDNNAKTLSSIGTNMGWIFQAQNDLEMFLSRSYQLKNKGNIYSDIENNRKNIILSKIPKEAKLNRSTNELIEYINDNHLIESVLAEIEYLYYQTEQLLDSLPKSICSDFLRDNLKKQVIAFNDWNKIK
jgi:geranylgeranyl pyrophosphate synthase